MGDSQILRNAKTWVPRTIGVILCAIIIWRLDLSRLLPILAVVDPTLVAVATCLLAVNILILAWRWHYLVGAQGIELGLLDGILMYWAGLAAGLVTPGRLGDLVKVLYIKRDGHSTGKSLVSVVLDRLLDLAFLVPVGLGGALLIWGMPDSIIWGVPPVLGTVLAAVWIIPKIVRPSQAMPRLLTTLIPASLREPMRVNTEDFLKGLKAIGIGTYSVASVVTIIAWALQFWMSYLLALSLGIHVSILYFSVSIAASSVAALLPISVVGIGPREAILVLAFSKVGIGGEFAVVYSALKLALTSVVVSGGALVLIRKPVR